LFVRIVSSVLRSFSPGHVEEYDQSHQGHEEHPASHGGDDKTGPLLVSGREGVGNVENRLDQSLLRGDFQHVVKLQPRGGELLLGGSVVTLPLPLPPRHHKEHKETDKCYESHTTHYGSDYEGQFFCLRGLEMAVDPLPAGGAVAEEALWSVAGRPTGSLMSTESLLQYNFIVLTNQILSIIRNISLSILQTLNLLQTLLGLWAD